MLFSRDYVPRQVIIKEFRNCLQLKGFDISLSPAHLIRRDGHDEEGCNWWLQVTDISKNTKLLDTADQISRYIRAKYNIDPLLDDCQLLLDATVRCMRISLTGTAVRRYYQNVIATLEISPNPGTQYEIRLPKDLIKQFILGKHGSDRQQESTAIASCAQVIRMAMLALPKTEGSAPNLRKGAA